MTPKQVKGFLAFDGTFFERQPECKRYEAMKSLETLCESNGINYDNFLATLNSWHQHIREYLDEDSKCKVKQAKADPLQVHYVDGDIPFDSVPSPDEDREDPSVGDKDAPGFLEQSFRRRE